MVTEATTNLRAALDGAVAGTGQFVASQILGVAGTLSFLLGLLVIPAWVLTMVADERGIKARATGLIAPAIRDDVVAVGRIVDRAFGTFLRTRVLLALVVGVRGVDRPRAHPAAGHRDVPLPGDGLGAARAACS